jgi:hypothetical protein
MWYRVSGCPSAMRRERMTSLKVFLWTK